MAVLKFGFAFLLGVFISACASAPGLKIKTWYLDENQGGLVRKNENKVLKFRDAQGYRCVSKSDFDALVEVYKSCR